MKIPTNNPKEFINNPRLIDHPSLSLNFKNWVLQHNPSLQWAWNDPEKLRKQLVATIKESGDLDIKTVFGVMFDSYDPDLSIEQNARFLNEKY